jgi:WD40 repeat protein
MSGVVVTGDRLAERWSYDLDDFPIAVACSRRGSWIAAATSSGPIVIFDARTGDVVTRFAGHAGGTLSISWSPDETLLASGGQDGALRIWDVAKRELIAECDGGAPWVEHVAFDPRAASKLKSQLIATAAGRLLRLWTADGQLVRSYAPHRSTVAALAWQSGVQEIVTAAYGALTIWTPSRDRHVRRFRWKGSILAIACSRDGRYIATGDQDCTVHFWRMKTGDDLQMSGYPAKVVQLSWDASNRYLATGGSDVVTIWDCKRSPAGTKPRTCEGHSDLITALAYQHRGDLLASADASGTVFVWAPVRSSTPVAKHAYDAEVVTVAWDPMDASIIAATSNGILSIRVYPSSTATP